ncbi:MAG: hypothetical protein H6868_02225 [Rhodospirillales bacterium]|nr:hypothetical protein [Rhodospirillales bacterium]
MALPGPKTGSVLTGNKDEHHLDAQRGLIQHMINLEHFAHELSFHHVELPTGQDDGSTYRALWAISPSGAYTVLHTHVLSGKDPHNAMATEPAYTVVRSPYPSVLKTLLENGQKRNHSDLFESAHIQVLKTYRERDIHGPENGNGLLDFRWAYETIRQFDPVIAKAREDHGLLSQETPDFCQNRSSLFWLKPDGRGKFHVNYYCNPRHNRTNLTNAEAMKKWFNRWILRNFSIQVTQEPVTRDEAADLIRQKFNRYAGNILEGAHPYTMPEQIQEMNLNGWQKFKHVYGKTTMLNTMQWFGVSISEMNKTKFLIGVGIAVGITVATQSFAALGVFAKNAKSNTVIKSANRIMNVVKNHFASLERQVRGDGKDMSFMIADGAPLRLGEDVAIHKLRPGMAEDVKAADMRIIGHAFPKTTLMSDDKEQERVKRIMIDPKTSPIGTVFRIVKMGERNWLQADETKGLRILYKPEWRMACVEKVRQPDKGRRLEDAIQKMLDEAGEDTMVLFEDENDFIQSAASSGFPEIVARKKGQFDDLKAQMPGRSLYDHGYGFLRSLGHEEIQKLKKQNWKNYKKSHKQKFRQSRLPALALRFYIHAVKSEDPGSLPEPQFQRIFAKQTTPKPHIT